MNSERILQGFCCTLLPVLLYIQTAQMLKLGSALLFEVNTQESYHISFIASGTKECI